MIQENIEIHDKYQFELKIGYKILEEDVDTLYNIEMYFFIPTSLDVNKNNYSKSDFYNDLQTYIRFKAPTVILRNIATGNGDFPIQKLKNSFEQLINHQDDESIAKYVRQIKMFSCIIKSALRDHVHFISKQKSNDDFNALVNEYINLVPIIATKYRELKSIINVPNISSKLHSYYLFGDEYLSFMIEESTYNLINYIKKHHHDVAGNFTAKLYDIIQNELNNRKSNQYPSIPKADDDNEELIFRKSVLKKFTSSVLYLKTTTEKEGVLLEQILFGIAAGCSMVFATAVAFYSQQKYGSISTTVFIVLIISYIFKDRIKELLRIYFAQKIHSYLFDHKTNLFIAEKENITLRQSYTRTLHSLSIMQRMKHKKQGGIVARKANKKVKTIAGRLTRELERKLTTEGLSRWGSDLQLFTRVLMQKRSDSNKIYSLHETDVQCYSKGKEHKKYEFGSKVSILITQKTGVIVGALNFSKNVHDSKTLPAVLEQYKQLTGRQAKNIFVDRGYKGPRIIEETTIQMPRPQKNITQTKRNRHKRRAAIEPCIGHLKSDYRLSRNFLKGNYGDMVNVLMAAAAMNFKRMMNLWKTGSHLFVLFLALLMEENFLTQKRNQFIVA